MVKPFVFILMPFEDTFNDIYQLGIKEAVNEAGGYCERVDEQVFEERILDRIYNQINKADFIIADMTGRNPNVFYEVGYAHALNKNVILLTSNAHDIPFDLKHHYHIIYNDKITYLKEQLIPRLKSFFSNPQKPLPNYHQLDFIVDNQKLEADKILNLEAYTLVSQNRFVSLSVKLVNNSDASFKDKFLISFTSRNYLQEPNYSESYKHHKTEEGNIATIKNPIPEIFPSDHFLLPTIQVNVSNYASGLIIPMRLRILSAIGIHDIPFKIELK